MLLIVSKKSRPAKPLKDYPEKNPGSEAAARLRAKANKMTEAQRKDYFRRAMVLIYGGQLPKETFARH
jgi:hypothetical protein